MAKKVFGWSPLRKLMKDNGADLITAECLDKLVSELNDIADKATQSAILLSKSKKGRSSYSDIMKTLR